MKASEVYLRAAELVDSGAVEFSCHAIDECSGGSDLVFSKERKIYERLFTPNGQNLYAWGAHWSEVESERKSCRTLALLFMREIALDEERSK